MQPGESLTFEQLIERSEQIARDTGANDVRTRIFATDFLATWYRSNGRYRNAEALLSSTADSLPAEYQRLGAHLRCVRAELWGQMGRSEEGLVSLTQELAQNQGDDAVAAQCLVSRSYFAANSGDAVGSLQFAEEALARYTRAGAENVYHHIEILLAIGAGQGLNGNYSAAHGQYREALRKLTSMGRPRGRAAANLHDEWSSLWLNAGNPKVALEEMDMGYEILRELAPNANLDDDRRNYRRARMLAQLARHDEAMASFASARAIALARANFVTLAGIQIGEADVELTRGNHVAAAQLLDAAQSSLRRTNLPGSHVLFTREVMTRAELRARQHNGPEARTLFARAIEAYEAKKCCAGPISYALSQRGEVAVLDGDLAAAAADIERARALAPPVEAESFSRFTGRAWYATGLLHERRGQVREARDAFAVAAVQFAGSLGEQHPDTLLARDAISRAAGRLLAKNHH
jgi:hypothetical protein